LLSIALIFLAILAVFPSSVQADAMEVEVRGPRSTPVEKAQDSLPPGVKTYEKWRARAIELGWSPEQYSWAAYQGYLAKFGIKSHKPGGRDVPDTDRKPDKPQEKVKKPRSSRFERFLDRLVGKLRRLFGRRDRDDNHDDAKNDGDKNDENKNDGEKNDSDTPPDTKQPPFDLSKVTWLHTDVSGWPVTSNLKVSAGNGVINLDYDKTNSWPGVEINSTQKQKKIQVNANPWVFVCRDGKWYGGTWEWLTVGTTRRNMKSVAGDHIKQHPLRDWRPRSGETVYFMVSSLARMGNIRNVQERTPPVRFVWP
jgi:hypothetical protein